MAKSLPEPITAPSIGSWLCLLQAERTYLYEQLPAYFGTAEDAARGGLSNEHFLRHLHAQDRKILAEESNRAIATGGTLDLTYRLHTPEGTRLLRAVGRCQYDPKSRMPALFGGDVFDVTPPAPGDVVREALRQIELARRLATPEKQDTVDYLAALARMEIDDMAGR